MHSQLALTEHASLNLAPLILLDPVGRGAAFLIAYQNRRDHFLWLSVIRGVKIVKLCRHHIYLPPILARSPAAPLLSSESHRRFDEAQLLPSLSLPSDFFCRTFFCRMEIRLSRTRRGSRNFSSRKVIAQLFGIELAEFLLTTGLG